MFDKKTVVYLTRNKIWVGNYANPSPRLSEFVWDGVDLTEPFSRIKKDFKIKRFRVILGDDLSYVLRLELTPEQTNRPEILAQADSLVPDDLTDENFDWKLVGFDPRANRNVVQVVAAKLKLAKAISLAVRKIGLKPEFTEVVSVLLASATVGFDEPRLIVWAAQEIVALICHRGTVYLSQDVSVDPAKKVATLIEFARDKFNLSLNQAVLDWRPELGGFGGLDKRPSFPSQWRVEERIIDPMDIAAQTKPREGKDEEVLTIKPGDKPEASEPQAAESAQAADQPSPSVESASPPSASPPPSSPQASEPPPAKPPEILSPPVTAAPPAGEEKKLFTNKKLLVVLGVVLVLGVVVVGGKLYSKSRSVEVPAGEAGSSSLQEETRIEPTQAEVMPDEDEGSAEDEASPAAEVELTDYSVQVLNGSGVAGEATRVEAVLVTLGFDQIETGNADSYDYTDTKVSRKDSVPDEVVEGIKEALSEYSVAEANFLPDDSDYDLVVVVGEKKG